MPSEINIPYYLREWFQDYDELIIPDLGRFEANYQTAVLQPSLHKILPPNKELFFDASVRSQDNTFAKYIAQQEAISLSEAEEATQAFVQALKAELGMRKVYKAEGFGNFIYTPNGNIDFEQSEDLIYAGNSFGLPELYNLKAVNAQKNSLGGTAPDFSNVKIPSDKPTTEPEDYNTNKFGIPSQELPSETEYDEDDDGIIVEEEIIENSSRKWTMLLTVLLLVVVVGAIITIIIDQDPVAALFRAKKERENSNTEILNEDPLEKEEILDGNRTKIAENDAQKEETNSKEQNQTKDDGFVGDVENPKLDYTTDESFSKSFSYNPQAPGNIDSYLVRRANTTPRYYVILGSFGSTANAYSYLNNLLARGANEAKIILPNDKNKTYRIAYKEFSSAQEARDKGKEFAKSNRLSYFILKY